MPEIFAYWLQGGRIDVGFLGAAQIDRLGNLNSTVIGDYDRPKVRLPGGGGAPEIAAMAKEVIVMLRQSRRSFVDRLDFRSSVGYGAAPGDRERLGMPGRGPTVVITDLGVLRPDPESCELTLTQVHPGRRRSSRPESRPAGRCASPRSSRRPSRPRTTSSGSCVICARRWRRHETHQA